RAFQVIRYKVEPLKGKVACYLLAKDYWRLALAAKVEERRPKMPDIAKPISRTCRAERLARARASPHGSITRPSGKVKGVSPAADSGKEVTLRVAAQVVGSDILDAPFVHVARRDGPSANQVPQPLRGVRVEFVVVSAHSASPICSSTHRCHASVPRP